MGPGQVWLCEVCKDKDCKHQGKRVKHSHCSGFCEYPGDYIIKEKKGEHTYIALKGTSSKQDVEQ